MEDRCACGVALCRLLFHWRSLKLNRPRREKASASRWDAKEAFTASSFFSIQEHELSAPYGLTDCMVYVVYMVSLGSRAWDSDRIFT
eukprot:4998307-Prymnesium_polylepis.1